MNKIISPIKHIPNFITSLNLLSGSLSVFLSFEGFPILAAYLVFLAAIFDFLDGFLARALKAYSEMGKELDSLADLISFGLAPAVIMFNILKATFFISTDISDLDPLPQTSTLLFLSVPLLIPVFSGLRLAKFNVDTRQTSSFLGLPTPANAIFWASFPIIMLKHPMFLNTFVGNYENIPYLISLGIILFSFLLVSELPMFALKFKNFSVKNNLTQFSFIIISAILLIIVGFKSVPIIIILYIVISLLLWIINKFKK
jgi:CDP-diacylglycerol--serine O-phosphatidyltransferase